MRWKRSGKYVGVGIRRRAPRVSWTVGYISGWRGLVPRLALGVVVMQWVERTRDQKSSECVYCQL